jgi:hypothetical protein
LKHGKRGRELSEYGNNRESNYLIKLKKALGINPTGSPSLEHLEVKPKIFNKKETLKII